MTSNFAGKTILITGGTGFFGQQFARTVLERHKVKKLIIFSRDEAKQYDMHHDPVFLPHAKVLRFFIGDVRDGGRLEMAFRDVDYVVHAAALKHISTAEYNPFECIRTNVHGAENIVNAAIRTGVKAVIALSTDKAVSPVNLYGASKLASDRIFLAARSLAGLGGPRFSVVRYGNVLGSRGSVIPFFRKLINEGATSLPITDSRMTRFWISLQQGIDFVLSSLSQMRGAEVFIPKLPSMKMIDLAEAMAPGLDVKIIGIRAGEKLHEAMFDEHEARSTLELDDRFVVVANPVQIKAMEEQGATRVKEGFSYVSNLESELLGPSEVATLIGNLGI